MKVCSICAAYIANEHHHAEWHKGPRTGEVGLDRLVAAQSALMADAKCETCNDTGWVIHDGTEQAVPCSHDLAVFVEQQQAKAGRDEK